MSRSMFRFWAALVAAASLAWNAGAAVLQFGDQDLCNTGTYSSDPTTGATLEGLTTGVVTYGADAVGHFFPFSPEVDDFSGTDQIFAGSNQTGFHDGYSSAQPTAGPQVLTLDYSSLVGAGPSVATLTLGVAADDFQFPDYGQPYTATINGAPATALTEVLNALPLGGPSTRFFTIGIDPNVLAPNHVLTLSIDGGGDGGDGWAVDFLTVGVTLVPEPATTSLVGLSAVAWMAALRQRRGYCRTS